MVGCEIFGKNLLATVRWRLRLTRTVFVAPEHVPEGEPGVQPPPPARLEGCDSSAETLKLALLPAHLSA